MDTNPDTNSNGTEKDTGAADPAPMKIRMDYVVAGLIALLVIGFIGREWISSPRPSPVSQLAPGETPEAYASFQEHTKTGLHYYYETKEYPKAEAEFRKSVDAAPGRALGYNNLGSSLNEQKKWDEAIPVLEKAVALEPSMTIAKNNLAYARVEKAKQTK
jgi:tetratricopeptide (TPR) repeat protein